MDEETKQEDSGCEVRRRFKIAGPEIRDGEKYFSPEDLALYELAQYKVANARQAVQLKQHEADDYQRRANEKLSQLQFQVKQLRAFENQKKDALLRLQSAIAKAYDVDLSKVTYDDETGRIAELPLSDAGTQPAA